MEMLKFRAWHKKEKKMILPYEIERLCHQKSGVHGIYRYRGKGTEYLNNSKIILLQSTGLKDKNGKEIFEGDIVKDENGNWIAKIVWDETWAEFGPKIIWQEDENCSYDIRMGRPERFEVIGNIHENPELLKEAKEKT